MKIIGLLMVMAMMSVMPKSVFADTDKAAPSGIVSDAGQTSFSTMDEAVLSGSMDLLPIDPREAEYLNLVTIAGQIQPVNINATLENRSNPIVPQLAAIFMDNRTDEAGRRVIAGITREGKVAHVHYRFDGSVEYIDEYAMNPDGTKSHTHKKYYFKDGSLDQIDENDSNGNVIHSYDSEGRRTWDFIRKDGILIELIELDEKENPINVYDANATLRQFIIRSESDGSIHNILK